MMKLQDFDDPMLFLEILNQLKQGTDFWEQIPDENQRIVAAEAIYNKIINDPLAQMEYTSMLKAEYRKKARIHDAQMKVKADIAKRCKELDVTTDVIAEATGLTKE